MRDFRNACALATIESGIALATVATGSVWVPLYSDHFVFGYHIPLRDGWVGTLTGIVEGVNDEVHKFCGQPSPQIGSPDFFKTQVDPVLLSRLMTAWKLRYQYLRGDYNLRKLFRALAVAFQASRYPSDGLTSVNDVGLRIASWVSAFEVLFHPGPDGKVNEKVVLDAIGAIKWPSARLNARRFRLELERKPYAANFPQAAYDELYHARNKFLHGEKVTRGDQHLHRSARRIPLMLLAPLLFGAAVRGVLNQILKASLTDDDEANEVYVAVVGRTLPSFRQQIFPQFTRPLDSPPLC